MGRPCSLFSGAKLPAAGWQAVVYTADCQGCDAARCPVFVVALHFTRDNNLAKGRGRCCWKHTAGVYEGGKGKGAINGGMTT